MKIEMPDEMTTGLDSTGSGILVLYLKPYQN